MKVSTSINGRWCNDAGECRLHAEASGGDGRTDERRQWSGVAATGGRVQLKGGRRPQLAPHTAGQQPGAVAPGGSGPRRRSTHVWQADNDVGEYSERSRKERKCVRVGGGRTCDIYFHGSQTQYGEVKIYRKMDRNSGGILVPPGDSIKRKFKSYKEWVGLSGIHIHTRSPAVAHL